MINSMTAIARPGESDFSHGWTSLDWVNYVIRIGIAGWPSFNALCLARLLEEDQSAFAHS